MPDKKASVPEKSWRKKIAVGRPKTPVQPKIRVEEAAATEEQTDRRHHSEKLGWRKTIQPNRPDTPFGTAGLSTGGDEGEEIRSEYSEPSTPRRRSSPKPSLKRYLSSYLTLTATPAIDFSTPWDELTTSSFITPVDPLIVLQSVHSFLCRNLGQPLPVQHNSGLLRLFEDYRKIREEKERLEALLKETLDGYKSSEEEWSTTEDRYQAEIRRLELIIAHGTSGMAGLAKARQGTIVKRKRTKTAHSVDRLDPTTGFLTPAELDKEILSRSQQVRLHRSTSPSDQMAAISQQFTSTGSLNGLKYGTPPSQERKLTLSRKIKSELDLAKMAPRKVSDTTSHSAYSEFSEAGDPLPDEAEPFHTTLLDAKIEGEAVVALRDLAVLVARRRGMDANKFLSNFKKLFSNVDYKDVERTAKTNQGEDTIRDPGVGPRFQHDSEPNPRRHFSFEPGEDQLALLAGKLGQFQKEQGQSACVPSPAYEDSPESSSSSSHTTSLHAEAPKPSKIPSPVQVMGSARRQSSAASLQTVIGRPNREDNLRRDSRSSVLMAFRQNSDQGTHRPQSSSRSSSSNNLAQKEIPFPRQLSSNVRNRHSMSALAAARAASASSESRGNSPVKSAGGGSSQIPSRNRTFTDKGFENEETRQSE